MLIDNAQKVPDYTPALSNCVHRASNRADRPYRNIRAAVWSDSHPLPRYIASKLQFQVTPKKSPVDSECIEKPGRPCTAGSPTATSGHRSKPRCMGQLPSSSPPTYLLRAKIIFHVSEHQLPQDPLNYPLITGIISSIPRNSTIQRRFLKRNKHYFFCHRPEPSKRNQ